LFSFKLPRVGLRTEWPVLGNTEGFKFSQTF